MGADIAWIGPTSSAAIILHGKLAIFKIGSDSYNFDGIEKNASSNIELIDSSTYVPLDVIEDVLNCEINEIGKVIQITTR